MPGIAGIIGARASVDSRSLVARMIQSMRHQPDYVSDINEAAECGACVGWIAHPGSFASRASGSPGTGLTLAFAGECFGGPIHGSDCDAPDAVLDTYRRRGTSFVGELNGLFSGALLDANARRSLLFVDRYASERIYFHQAGDAIYFASEAKALLAVLPKLRALDPDGVAEFLAFGSCRGGKTLFKGISRLIGGSLWAVDPRGVVKRQTYFDPSEWENLEPLNADQFEEEFVDTARSVVPRYVRSDTDVGFSVTGGLDTRMILACLSGAVSNLVCYTYGAADGDTLDVRIGRELAGHLGYAHQTLRIDDSFISDFQAYLDRSIYISDGCASALGTHELFFSQLAGSVAPVRLTGNFGSELLRSMSTLKPSSLADGLIANGFTSRVEDAIADRRHSHSLSGTVFDEIPSHLFGPLAIARSQLTFRTPYLDNSIVKLAFQAPDASRQTPAAALRLIASGHEQLGKTPTDLGFSCERQLPWGAARRLLSKVAFKLDYWDKEGLPPKLAAFDSWQPLLQRSGLLGLHKYLPYRRWFKEELREVVERATARAADGGQPWWNAQAVTSVAADHVSGRSNYLREINAIVTLDAVQRILIESSLEQRAADDSRLSD